jgi:putative pyruvate formate lyase activating enzyme
MNNARSFIQEYFDILEESNTAKYLLCKHILVDFNKDESTAALWKKHESALKKLKITDELSHYSLLDLKIELASRIFQCCHFCEKRCGVDRRQKTGSCGVKEARITSEFLHTGEERMLVPSYTVFFSGCTFNCVFCQNWDISQRLCGFYLRPSVLADKIDMRKKDGAKNVNWVGGDPTPNLLYILRVLRECEINIPQVWNSNMYCSIETMKILDGVIDLYLTDFKYGNDDCAKRLSIVDNYVAVVKRNHRIAHNQAEMIIRHLVLPNHISCCTKPILRWIKENMPNALVNIMDQYKPEYKARDYSDIARSLSYDEYIEVKKFAEKIGLNLV